MSIDVRQSNHRRHVPHHRHTQGYSLLDPVGPHCWALVKIIAEQAMKSLTISEGDPPGLPPHRFPSASDLLPRQLATEISRYSQCPRQLCAVAGVTGPLVAVLEGAADALGVLGSWKHDMA